MKSPARIKRGVIPKIAIDVPRHQDEPRKRTTSSGKKRNAKNSVEKDMIPQAERLLNSKSTISFFSEFKLSHPVMKFLKGKRLTVCVTGAGVGVDSAWEQEKLEARKLLENAPESLASSARFVGQTRWCKPCRLKKNYADNLMKF